MDFQKIILAGIIISDPVIQKIDDGYLDFVTFKISVHFLTESEIIFSVEAYSDSKEISDDHIQKGSEVLIEGYIDQDRTGNYFVFADNFQTVESGKRTTKTQKLLF